MPKAILIILDGWGINDNPLVSAIAAAKTPFYDSLLSTYPHATLTTYGEHVGLPAGQMGNSEVGHINIGAGRIIYQDLARINKSIREHELDHNPFLLQSLSQTKGRLHLMGLVSDGGVHSHIDHLTALAQISRQHFNGEIFIHAFTDGRDVDPKSGLGFLTSIQHHLANLNIPVVSVIGRYYAMDRDRRWERTKLAYDLLVSGIGEKTHDINSNILNSYAAGITDEFIRPIVLADQDGLPAGRIRNGDAVIFFNFRTDRTRQLTEVLTQRANPEYDMSPLDIHMITMTSYDNSFKEITTLYQDADVSNTLGEYLSGLNKTQMRVSETEKYPHVSYFFSGGREDPYPGESRLLIPSPKVPTYDLLPEMSAPGVTRATIEFIQAHRPDFICLNFANADMVGHTGVFNAAVMAVESVDHCLSQLVPVCLEYGYEILIIADHGNADLMINPDGSPNTAHTKNPVPVIYISNKQTELQLRSGILADIAPTLLFMMNLPIPDVMTGQILISR